MRYVTMFLCLTLMPAAACITGEISVASLTTPSAALSWYETCGYPICREGSYKPVAGIPACTTQVVGAPCTIKDALCDLQNDCGIRLLCTDSDPKGQKGGCPISRKKYKKDIDYLTEEDREKLRENVLQLRLARYHYITESAKQKRHLGFIIEDLPDYTQLPAVTPDGKSVDLYGYISMAISAVQTQAKEIAALKAEVRALQSRIPAKNKQ